MRLVMPLVIFLIVIGILFKGLWLHPSLIPSPLINKSVPHFRLTALDNARTVTEDNLRGQVTLLNVWATWCVSCAEEHSMLLQLAKEEHIAVWGLDYKDDNQKANAWLNEYGNPYQVVLADSAGNVAIDFGVYGTPETFVIDKKGLIRYKQTGPITETIWNNTLKPLVQKLMAEPA